MRYAYINFLYVDGEGWRFTEVTPTIEGDGLTKIEMEELFGGEFVKRFSRGVKEMTFVFPTMEIGNIFLKGMLAFQNILNNGEALRQEIADHLIEESMNNG